MIVFVVRDRQNRGNRFQKSLERFSGLVGGGGGIFFYEIET